MVKTRENGESKAKQVRKKPSLSQFRTTLPVMQNFRITHPLCENAFVAISKKTCSRSLPKIPYANFTGMRTLCEPCANSFLGQIFKTMLSVWVLTGMRNFRITQGVMRNLHFLFKDCVLPSHAHFLLHFSQHLSSDHPIQALHLPNQSLKLRIQATFSSKETHFRRVEELQISKFLREKAPISKPSHHQKYFCYLSQHFPPSKAKNFHL